MSETTQQYITFKLGNETFAINVEQVREVLEVSAITKLPGCPSYLRGVVNVREQAIPVVDLRQRFGLPPAAETVATRIIVMEVGLLGEVTVLGGMADSVHEVIELDPASINPPPRLAMRWKAEFILGMARRGEDFLILLDVNAIFASNEIVLVTAAMNIETTTSIEPVEA